MSKIVATIGMFDGVHLGHQDLLRHVTEEAAKTGTRSLAVTFANHPASVICPNKVPKLITTPDEKSRRLSMCGVGYVLTTTFTQLLRAMTAKEYIQLLRHEYNVETLILGFNNRFGSDTSLTFDDYVEIGKSEGVKIIRMPEYFVNGTKVNSTIIREHILAGDINKANSLLGYEFLLEGKVVFGKQVGRTIGFPTANINVGLKDKIIPANGVYACRAMLKDGSTHPTMVNIGTRPTIDGKNSDVTIEAHIIGISKELYGNSITLSFISRLRDEQRFKDIDALKAQLEKDKLAALDTIGL